ncbi:hypothetical protein [Pedobacter immunditicola]|uniref:hypothetical protein n=1 Tax=Pedobacter immunditicola TaxID=3133440 RepID=UPI003094956E
MAAQLTSNMEALRLFFTDDIYLIANDVTSVPSVAQETAVVKETPEVKNDVPVIETSAPVPNYQFLGENSRKVLILVNDANNPVSSPAGTALLWKIVTAIKLSPNDCAVLNYQQHQGVSFEELTAYFQPQLLLSFGIAPATMGLSEQQTELIGLQGTVKTIFSSELDALEVDITIKKALWKSLQQLTLS